MTISPTVASLLFSSSAQGSSSLINIAAGLTTATTSGPQRDPLTTFIQAEKTQTEAVARKAKEPAVAREIAAFKDGVRKAKSVDDLLNDRKAMSVILTANGLDQYLDAKGMVSRTLKSDGFAADSVAAELGKTNRAWLTTTQTYDFANRGLSVIQQDSTLNAIADAYAKVKWQNELETQAPGVSFALAFKEIAKDIDEPFKVLGNPVAREVVLTVLQIPPQIAYQSLESQSRTIETKFDLEKLQDPKFVDTFVKRYLISKNSASSGLVV